MQIHNPEDLLLEVGLRHLYSSENEDYNTLQILLENAASSELKETFQHHREETKQQIERLHQVFRLLDIDITSTTLRNFSNFRDKTREFFKTLQDMNFTDRSKGMDGIVGEGKELVRHFAHTDAIDMALISAGQKAEHFEIACYNSVCLLLEKRKLQEALELMKTSLSEEIRMQERLLRLAVKDIRKAA